MGTILSVNVGRAVTVKNGDRSTRTAIFKQPTRGTVKVLTLGLEGDQQADQRYHGGPHMAVYIYPAAHYATFSRELGREIPFGLFGENLPVTEFDESDVCAGDVFTLGSGSTAAEVEVASPRMPCSKLAMVMDVDFVRRFLESGRVGWYCRVLREGEIEAGAPITRTRRGTPGVTIRALAWMRGFGRGSAELLNAAVNAPALDPRWPPSLRSKWNAANRSATPAQISHSTTTPGAEASS